MMSTIGEWTLASPDSSETIGLESPEGLMLHLSYKVKKKKKEKKTQEVQNVDLSSQLQIEYNWNRSCNFFFHFFKTEFRFR